MPNASQEIRDTAAEMVDIDRVEFEIVVPGELVRWHLWGSGKRIHSETCRRGAQIDATLWMTTQFVKGHLEDGPETEKIGPQDRPRKTRQ